MTVRRTHDTAAALMTILWVLVINRAVTNVDPGTDHPKRMCVISRTVTGDGTNDRGGNRRMMPSRPAEVCDTEQARTASPIDDRHTATCAHQDL